MTRRKIEPRERFPRRNTNAQLAQDNSFDRTRSMVHSFGLPKLSEAPRDATVLEAKGPYAVALCRNGVYLGLFRRA